MKCFQFLLTFLFILNLCKLSTKTCLAQSLTPTPTIPDETEDVANDDLEYHLTVEPVSNDQLVLELVDEAPIATEFLNDNTYKVMFEAYIRKYRKRYTADNPLRFRNYKRNLDRIILHNSQPGVKYQLAINEHSDMTWGEFKRAFLDSDKVPTLLPIPPEGLQSLADIDAIPASHDWRTKNVLTPIRNQGGCGSCWAFSSIAAIEGNYHIQNQSPILVELSDQQVLDCSGGGTCAGGMPPTVFTWAKTNPICKRSEYPYVAAQRTCKPCTGIVKTTSFQRLQQTELDMMDKSSKGILMTYIFASWKFQLYSSGIFNAPDCNLAGSVLNHGVNIVGYAPTYWIIRNSWGATWGENGYMRLERGTNRCNVNYHNYMVTISQAPTPTSTTSTTSPPTNSPTPSPFNLWRAGQSYAIGYVVVYNNILYYAQQAHVSVVGQTPNNLPATWVNLGPV